MANTHHRPPYEPTMTGNAEAIGRMIGAAAQVHPKPPPTTLTTHTTPSPGNCTKCVEAAANQRTKDATLLRNRATEADLECEAAYALYQKTGNPTHQERGAERGAVAAALRSAADIIEQHCQ